MPALRPIGRIAVIAASMSMTSSLALGAALADVGGGSGSEGGTTTGGEQGQTITAGASSVRFGTSKNGAGSAVGPLTSAGDWTPPPCWYEPTYTPEQFKQENEKVWGAPSVGSEWKNGQKEKYAGGHPYTNFNVGKSGYWWEGVQNPSMAGDAASLVCSTTEPFWVAAGAPPPAGIKNPVSPYVLAELAYQQIRVPDTAVSLSPSGKQTVNLNTWAWLNKATFKPVSVTARLDRLNIWATTTATPVALHLDPGTPDATVYPSSGDCPITDGSIGTRYAAADGNRTPACGVTYLRATTGRGPYELKATITWKVSWSGSGDAGGVLPNGTFGTTTPLTVQEVQSVVR